MAVPSVDTDWLAKAAAARPHATALVTGDGARIAYSRLDELAGRAAAQLHKGFDLAPAGLIGFAPVSVHRELVAALWGTWRMGAAAMIVDPHSRARAGGAASARRNWGVADFITQLELPENPARPRVLSGPDSLHTVLLTSGSTGEPRPVRLTHRNVSAAVTASAFRIGNTGDDRWLLTLPIWHIGGLSILWRSAAAGGAVVVHDGFDAARVAGAMRDGSVTIASLVPTMLHRILEVDPGPYDGMRAVLLGGAAADRRLVERGLQVGLPILQTYGMTEACSQVATVAPGAAVESLGTVGLPLGGMEVAIDGDTAGEIVIEGPAVSPGYLGETDRKGGHRTGDIGYLDEGGRLVVLGRTDDMIVTGGENVYPGLVADVIARHDAVRGIEVVGVPDPEWGHALVAVVAGPVAAQGELSSYARCRLDRHEIPKRWVFVDAIPLQANGKVDRAAVLDIALTAG